MSARPEVRYSYIRFNETFTEVEDSLEAALIRASGDIELNLAYPLRVEAVDGSFRYERGEPFEWDGSLDKLLAERSN